MPGVTKEQIAKAKEWDLLSYLRAYEPQELKKCGNEYQTVGHGSLKISNGKWHWHSRGIGGRTALDYLIKVRGMGFVEAVEALCGGSGAAGRGPGLTAAKREPSKAGAPQNRKPPQEFILPEENRCGTAVVSYLQRRGIAPDIISQCIGAGILYESRRYKNCVFVGRDPAGKARYACLRGSGSTFKGEVAGSDKRYGFYLPAADPGSSFAAVAESPIDILSVATLLKIQGEDWTNCHYLSLGGTAPRALLQFLHDHPAVTNISLCVDNDKAGLICMEKIREAVRDDPDLSGRIRRIVDNPPPVSCGKDYNELLRNKIVARHQQKEKKYPQKGMEL